MAITFLVFFSIGSLFAITPRLVTRGLGGDAADVGRISATFAIAAICCRPLLSLALRRGMRWVALAGAVLLVSGISVLTRAPNLIVVAIAELLIASGETFLWTSVTTFSTAGVPGHRQAEAIALGSGPIFVGYALGPLAADRFAVQGRFTTALVIPTIASSLAFLLAWRIRSEWAPPSAHRGRLKRSEIFHRNALRPGIAYLFITLGWSAWSAYIALRADELGLRTVGGLFVVYSIVSLTIRFVGAKIPDMIGLIRCALATAVSISCGLAIIGFSNSTFGLYAGAVFISTGISLVFPTMSAISLRGLPDPSQRAILLSSISMFFDVGIGLGGFLLGPFARDAGIAVAFRIGSGIVLLSLPLIIRLGRGSPDPVSRVPIR